MIDDIDLVKTWSCRVRDDAMHQDDRENRSFWVPLVDALFEDDAKPFLELTDSDFDAVLGEYFGTRCVNLVELAAIMGRKRVVKHFSPFKSTHVGDRYVVSLVQLISDDMLRYMIDECEMVHQLADDGYRGGANVITELAESGRLEAVKMLHKYGYMVTQRKGHEVYVDGPGSGYGRHEGVDEDIYGPYMSPPDFIHRR